MDEEVQKFLRQIEEWPTTNIPQENYITINTVAGADTYVKRHPCSTCGGAWIVANRYQRNDNQPKTIIHDQYNLQCLRCKKKHTIVFVMDTNSPEYQRQLIEIMMKRKGFGKKGGAH